MDIETLTQKIQAANLVPVRIAFTPIENSELRFIGSLEEYIAAVQALHGTAIFIGAATLEEGDFLYGEEDGDEDIDDEDEVDHYDLRSVDPKLNQFSHRIGEACVFQLTAPVSNERLKIDIVEDWWEQFSELVTAASERLDQLRDANYEELEAELNRRKAAHLEKIRVLVNDPDFRRLPTQKAMCAYAIEKFPEVAEFEGIDIKREIQNLVAQMQAKGLRGR